jgi:PST family polysaccharide transporter
MIGPSAVGVYRMAQKVADVIYMVSSKPYQYVAHPLLAELQKSPEQMGQLSRRLIRMNVLTGAPIFIVAAAVMPSAAPLIGPEWGPASLPASVLCVVGVTRALTFLTGPILYSSGQPYRRAALVGVTALSTTAAYVIASAMTVEADLSTRLTAIALAELASVSVVGLPVAIYVLYAYAKLGPFDLAKASLPGFALATVCGAVTAACFAIASHAHLTPWVTLLLSAAAPTPLIAAILARALRSAKRPAPAP